VTFAVSLSLKFVDGSVHLDSQPHLMAIEVEQAAYGMLPSELTARQRTVAQG
jgi:hypothetical protein